MYQIEKGASSPIIYFIPFGLTIVECTILLSYRVKLNRRKIAPLRLWQDARPDSDDPAHVLPARLWGGKADLHPCYHPVASLDVMECSSHFRNLSLWLWLASFAKSLDYTLCIVVVKKNLENIFLCRKWLEILDLRQLGFSRFSYWTLVRMRLATRLQIQNSYNSIVNVSYSVRYYSYTIFINNPKKGLITKKLTHPPLGLYISYTDRLYTPTYGGLVVFCSVPP